VIYKTLFFFAKPQWQTYYIVAQIQTAEAALPQIVSACPKMRFGAATLIILLKKGGFYLPARNFIN